MSRKEFLGEIHRFRRLSELTFSKYIYLLMTALDNEDLVELLCSSDQGIRQNAIRLLRQRGVKIITSNGD